MVGGAAGGFVTRAFESMLKECAIRKYNSLQSATQAYLDSGKDLNQQPNIGDAKDALSEEVSNQSLSESDAKAEESEEGDDPSIRTPSAAEEVNQVSEVWGRDLLCFGWCIAQHRTVVSQSRTACCVAALLNSRSSIKFNCIRNTDFPKKKEEGHKRNMVKS